MSSRTAILDQVLAIRNLLALNDHELEQVINLNQELLEASKMPGLDNDRADFLDSYYKDIKKTMEEYNTHYLLRKELQKQFFDEYNVDMSYWCQFKHRLTIQEALKELADVEQSKESWGRFNSFTKDLYTWIGEITGLGHTPCGRCLLDAEQEEKPAEKIVEKVEEKPDEELDIMVDVVNHANKIIPGDYITYTSYDHLRKRYREEYPKGEKGNTDNVLHETVAKWLCDKNIINVTDSLMKDKRTSIDRRTNDMFDLLKSKYEERLLPFVKEGKTAFNKDFIDKICEDMTVDKTALASNKNQDD